MEQKVNASGSLSLTMREHRSALCDVICNTVRGGTDSALFLATSPAKFHQLTVFQMPEEWMSKKKEKKKSNKRFSSILVAKSAAVECLNCERQVAGWMSCRQDSENE